MPHRSDISPRLLLAVMLLVAFVSPRLRAATAAGTVVPNAATVNYQTGGVAQPAITSSTCSFVVDRKIDLSIATTNGAAVSVSPGSTGNVLSFTLQNTGNGTQDFHLSAVTSSGGTAAFGGTDNTDATSVAVFVESGATAGYQAGEDTATYVDELAASATKTIYIVGDFSSGSFTNGQIANYHLLAEARAGGAGGSEGAALTETTASDTAGSEDVVFADGQGSATSDDATRDARYSAASAFVISSATLSVTKTSVVISDPFNSTTNPKAIPGAVVEYTITISNAAGAATATNVVLSDSLHTEITAGTIAFLPNAYATGKGIRVTTPNLNSGATLDLTNVGGDDEGDWNITATNVLTVTGLQLAASESAVIKFRVQIQ